MGVFEDMLKQKMKIYFLFSLTLTEKLSPIFISFTHIRSGKLHSSVGRALHFSLGEPRCEVDRIASLPIYYVGWKKVYVNVALFTKRFDWFIWSHHHYTSNIIDKTSVLSCIAFGNILAILDYFIGLYIFSLSISVTFSIQFLGGYTSA